MALNIFTPTSGSTHFTFRSNYNTNILEIESRLSGVEAVSGNYAPLSHQHVVGDVSGLGTMATENSADYAPASHQHVVGDIDSATAVSGYVITADGAGNATWGEQQGGGATNFSVITVDTPTYTQIPQHTHHLYDDSALSEGPSGEDCIIVDLLDPTLHEAVTHHKKIGDGSGCSVLLLPPSGRTIDGVVSDGLVSGYLLTLQYESISIFSDGVSGYYIQ